MLDGLMMDYPLTLTHFLERAARLFPRREIVSRRPDHGLVRHTMADLDRRSRQLAGALRALGVKEGARVATLAWNSHRHLEAYFGVPAMGAVVHTLNPRLHPDEITFIARHAEDEVVLVDSCLLPLWEKVGPHLPQLRHTIVMADDAAQVPEGMLNYETLLGAAQQFELPRVEENSAAMLCYTSGTTGNPKGVLYSHRSSVLHAITACLRATVGISSDDSVLAVVPMFHAASWGLAYAAVAMGANLVLPGPHLDPISLLELMEQERVTVAGGVPTIWLGILDRLDREPQRFDLSSMRVMAVGGAAAPPSMIEGFQQRHGLRVLHAWGMTETSPIGTMAVIKPHMEQWGSAEKLRVRATQGFPVPFVEHRHVGEEGQVLPWDGETLGELEVRGPWVARAYYSGEGSTSFTADGWFRTGDVVTIDSEGYLTINDRSKDVIKSGGEWISSVALENALMAHPAVLEAAVFAARHPKWSERPVAAIVCKVGRQATSEELGAYLAERFAKYCLPDEYVFLQQIPRTSTGKFLKTRLREQYGDILLTRQY